MTTTWLVCDGIVWGKGEFCLYTERSAARLKGDPCRCIRHGEILTWAHTFATDREGARAELTEGRA